jgi:hypothetical protein
MTNPKRIHALNAHFKNWQTLQCVSKMRMRAELLELRQRWTQRNDLSLIISNVASFDEISRQMLTDVDRRKNNRFKPAEIMRPCGGTAVFWCVNVRNDTI